MRNNRIHPITVQILILENNFLNQINHVAQFKLFNPLNAILIVFLIKLFKVEIFSKLIETLIIRSLSNPFKFVNKQRYFLLPQIIIKVHKLISIVNPLNL